MPPVEDMLSRAHFDAISSRYARSTETLEAVHDAARAELSARLEGRDVLDVGGGGLLPYDASRAASVTALDLSPAMLARMPAGVRRVLGDARRMPLPDASFDAVVFSLSLHHVERPEEALAEAVRVLRPGGELLVHEPVLSPALFALERALAPLTRAVLALFGVPMVLFQSRESLRALVEAACGGSAAVTEAELEGWSDPLGGTFPGLLLIPPASMPTRFVLLRATVSGFPLSHFVGRS
jgi:ubiquinone/menaquinone biosynthesis C-methylase UbiE